jgi:hypothetical protein
MRESRRDHYLPPVTDDDTETVVDTAIASLGELRGLDWLGDAPARLHLLASLIAETERCLPPAVADARDQECSWAQIGDLLGVTRASAQQRYTPRTTPADPDRTATH